MLHNEKYVGIHVWNKTKTILNPIKGCKEQVPRP